MNTKAEGHLAKAEGYFAKGDAWYAKAADEIIAAKEADSTLSNREIGERFGRSENWARRVVTWRTTSTPESPIDWGRGSHATTAEIQAGAEKLLKTAPLETVEHLVEKLTPKQAAKVAQAALGKPDVARELAKNPEASAQVTRVSGQVREEREATNKERTRKSSGALGQAKSTLAFLANVLGNLVVAKRGIRDAYDAVREMEMDDEQRGAVAESLDEIRTMLDWFQSYLDSGDQSFEDELSKLLSDD